MHMTELSDPLSEMSTSGVCKAYESFDEMGLEDTLTRGIYTYGFERPSHIQQLAIVPMSKHTDILAQAQSGTGKTGAFTIGSLSVINISIKFPQVLI